MKAARRPIDTVRQAACGCVGSIARFAACLPPEILALILLAFGGAV